MQRPRPGRLAAALALTALGGVLVAGSGRARGGRDGTIVRVDRPAVEQVHVEAGWFVMGVQPRDLEALIGVCEQACNLRVPLPAPAGMRPEAVSLCVVWAEALERRAPRSVWIDGFSIDRREVTQAAYRGCVQAGACSPVPLTGLPREHTGDDRPIAWVTRDEAATYCSWRGGRLPTEAEWEKAARGTDGRTWPWGDAGRVEHFNHGKPREAVLQDADSVHPSEHGIRVLGDPDESDGARYAAAAGAMRWSRGPYGAVDQAGNVAEWVADDWSERGYDGLPAANPQRVGPAGSRAITRGGSWRDPPFLARTDLPTYASAYDFLSALDRSQRALHIGFRCVYGGALPDTTSRGAATDPP